MDRRAFLAGLAAVARPRGLSRAPGSAAGTTTRLILLGTGGGPRPRKASSASAQVVIANGAAYVVDCGDGVARQLVFAGIALETVRHIFLTHQHSDHNADYGNLIWLSWAAGLRTRVDTWGPPPLERMTRLFFEMNAYDIDTRIANEGRVPLLPLVHVHELQEGGLVIQDETVRVTAALVDHPPVVPAFGYRFDAADRSIVISGDTSARTPSSSSPKAPTSSSTPPCTCRAIDRLVARVPNAPGLKQSILSHHTSAEDAGRVAQAAGVKLLVLSHLVPPDDPAITDQMWIDAAGAYFKGKVIVGHDLQEI